MPCSRSRPSALARWLALGALLLVAFSALAAEITVDSAQIGQGEEGYALDAAFSIDLGPRLEEVVSRGVALHFVIEFELTKPRWYWADEHIAGRVQNWRLSYHALTRQYRLSSGALHQSFATLDEALHVLSHLRGWLVAEKGALKAGEPYNAALRMKLDLAQMPKPFQVTAIGNKDWNLAAEIRRWSYTPAAENAGK